MASPKAATCFRGATGSSEPCKIKGDQESAIADLEAAAEIYQKEGKESLYQEVQKRMQQLESRME